MNASPGSAPPGSPLVEAEIGADESAAWVVVTAVAAVADDPVTALPPLYEFVDPDALEALFPEDADAGSVAFTYNDYRVVVSADGTVEVYETSS